MIRLSFAMLLYNTSNVLSVGKFKTAKGVQSFKLVYRPPPHPSPQAKPSSPIGLLLNQMFNKRILSYSCIWKYKYMAGGWDGGAVAGLGW